MINKELKISNEENDSGSNNENRVLKEILPIDDGSIKKRFSQPFANIITDHFKDFKNDVIMGINYWLKAPQKVVNIVSEIVDLLYCYAVMIDDLQDNSTLRKGMPCAYLIHGIPNTLNSLQFLMTCALKLALSLDNLGVTEIFYNITQEFLRGRSTEIYWREKSICPTEQEYKLMALRKCGIEFFMIQHLLKYYSTETIDLTHLVSAVILFFQINDDYLNLASEEYQKSKGYCEDITEGKFSFPILYVVNNFPEEGKIVKRILRQRTNDSELLKYCKSIIVKCGGLEYTKKAINRYRSIAVAEADKLGPNPFLDRGIIDRYMKGDFPVVVF